MRDFQERMAIGRELAQVARNRGQHTGKSAKGWDNVKRRELSPFEQRMEECRTRMHARLDDAREQMLDAIYPQRRAFNPETDIPF